jgi:peptidoglycan/xylan/chitin deacetylase (PgdA/CDA1 family)
MQMNSGKELIKTIAGFSFQKLLTVLTSRKDLRLIFMYHRVVQQSPAGLHDPALFVTANTLEMHIREIARHFEIVPIDSIIAPADKGKRLCAFTFDDGWHDNYDSAFAVLKKYRVPATIFIPVSMVSLKQSFWFQNLWELASHVASHGNHEIFIDYFRKHTPSWRLAGIGLENIYDLTNELKRLPAKKLDTIVLQGYERLGIKPSSSGTIMNWEQIREMGQYGITFGSHGLHHNILTQLSYDAKCDEVTKSFEGLHRAEVAVAPFFSYPNGNWDAEAVSLVKQAGYKGAVTTELGFNASSTNPYLLKRIALHEDISHTASLLWFRIFQALIARQSV